MIAERVLIGLYHFSPCLVPVWRTCLHVIANFLYAFYILRVGNFLFTRGFYKLLVQYTLGFDWEFILDLE